MAIEGWRAPARPRPTLLLMAGMPGSGKSTLARALSTRLGWPLIDKDTILSRLLRESIAEEAAQPASYDVMFNVAAGVLGVSRRSVILDSPAAYPATVESARRICGKGDAQLKAVLCFTDRKTRNRRVSERAAKLSQPVGISQTADYALDRFSHLPLDTLQVETNEPVEALVALVISSLRL